MALAGIAGGIGGGLGTAIKGTGFLAGAARGASGSALTQGIATATGLQDSFGWASVAAAGIGGGIGAAVGGRPGDGFGGRLAANTAGALANAATRSALTGESFGRNLSTAIPDVVGQAIGNAVAGAVAGNRGSPAAQAVEPPAVRATTGEQLSGAIVDLSSAGYIGDALLAPIIAFGGIGAIDSLGGGAAIRMAGGSSVAEFGRRQLSRGAPDHVIANAASGSEEILYPAAMQSEVIAWFGTNGLTANASDLQAMLGGLNRQYFGESVRPCAL